MDIGFQLPEDIKMLQTWVRDFFRREILPLEKKMCPEATELAPEKFDRLSKLTKGAGM